MRCKCAAGALQLQHGSVGARSTTNMSSVQLLPLYRCTHDNLMHNNFCELVKHVTPALSRTRRAESRRPEHAASRLARGRVPTCYPFQGGPVRAPPGAGAGPAWDKLAYDISKHAHLAALSDDVDDSSDGRRCRDVRVSLQGLLGRHQAPSTRATSRACPRPSSSTRAPQMLGSSTSTTMSSDAEDRKRPAPPFRSYIQLCMVYVAP